MLSTAAGTEAGGNWDLENTVGTAAAGRRTETEAALASEEVELLCDKSAY